MNDCMKEGVRVLDRGYVRLVEAWGSDERIIEAARMSTARGFLGWGGAPCPNCAEAGRLDATDRLFIGYEAKVAAHDARCACGGTGKTVGDEKLLKFLWDHNHASPFEMAGLVVEVKAPIVVFREWHRHRTQSYNEMSARYVPLPDESYMPSVERVLIANQGTTNKQAQGSGRLIEEADALGWLAELAAVYEHAQRVYAQGIALGVPKELARLPVPVARYSAMRASANLRNWLGFLKLRCDPAAQWEIRPYANAVAEMLRGAFPRVHEVAARSTGLP